MRGIRVLTKEAHGAPGPFAACGHGEAAKHTPTHPAAHGVGLLGPRTVRNQRLFPKPSSLRCFC